MNIRLKDIANKLKISESTVSRALADDPRISDATKTRVNKIAKELNYTPNLIAKSLKIKKTKTLGIIISDITNPFYPEIIRGVEDIANENDFNLILCNSDNNHAKELKYLKVLIGKRVDGILLTPSNYNLIGLLIDNKIPFVLIDVQPNKDVNCVYVDQEHIGKISAEYLLKMGHKKIGIVNGPKNNLNCYYFEKGFLNALRRNRIKIEKKHILECDLKRTSSYDVIKKLIQQNGKNLPTAFAFISDETALGAYDAIKELCFSIPEDFSLIGCDDILFSRFLDPSLTTISLPKYEMGVKATGLLMDVLINHKKTNDIKILLPELLERKSVILKDPGNQ